MRPPRGGGGFRGGRDGGRGGRGGGRFGGGGRGGGGRGGFGFRDEGPPAEVVGSCFFLSCAVFSCLIAEKIEGKRLLYCACLDVWDTVSLSNGRELKKKSDG